jgi:hypothetical protein
VTEIAAVPTSRKQQLAGSALVCLISLAVLFLVSYRQPQDAAQPWTILDIVLQSLVVTVVYAIGATFCRMSIAAAMAAVALLWHVGRGAPSGWPVLLLCLLNLLGVAALLPSYVRWVSKRQLAAAGAVAGLALMVRSDAGVALLVVEILLLGSVAWWHIGSPRLHFWFEKALPVAAGFAIVAVPCAAFLLLPQTARWRPAVALLATGSSPRILESFLVIATAAISLLTALTRNFSLPGTKLADDDREYRQFRGFLVAFALLTTVMYLLGSLHYGYGQIYLSFMPSLLLLALLLQHGSALRGFVRFTAIGLSLLSVIAALGRLPILHRAP